MRSNTAQEGCDPAGVYSPAARDFPTLTGRQALGRAFGLLALALFVAALISAVR